MFHKMAMADRLTAAKNPAVLLGNLCSSHAEFSTLRYLAGNLAEISGANFGYLPEAANSAGAWLSGALPHRQASAQPAPVLLLVDECLLKLILINQLLFDQNLAKARRHNWTLPGDSPFPNLQP